MPAEGRSGPAPAWPLQLTNDREQDLWADLWSKPQAIEWERCGQEIQVALYVRKLTEAEEWGAAVARATLVNQMAGALGLTTPGLAANRWRIAPAEAPKAAPAPRTSSKRRLTVVEGPNAVEGSKPAG